MINLLMGAGLLFAALHAWSTIMIWSYLKTTGEHTDSFVLIRAFTFRYINRYKAVTTRKNGRPGYLWHVWVFSVNLALLCLLLAILLTFLP